MPLPLVQDSRRVERFEGRVVPFVPSLTDSTERASDRRAAPPRKAPFLFIALEGARPLAGGARILLRGVSEVVVTRGAVRSVARATDAERATVTVTLPDPQVSQVHARFDGAEGAWTVSDAGSTNGTWVRGERADRTPLADGDVVFVGQTAFLYRELEDTGGVRADTDHVDLEATPGLATLDPLHGARLTRLKRLAHTTVPVLLLGESGTGKELLARAIHALSGRPGPLVAVNCGAIAETLAESQLFGHVKGAFSGAVRDEKGFVRAADGGTLFLDEIGDLPAPTQAALLRVLQEGEVTPVGANRPVVVDIRVVCATHQPLAELVQRGTFRADLLARIAGCTHELSPLRARHADFGTLVAAILRGLSDPEQVRFDANAVRALLRYDWPMNVRELQRCLATSTALADGHRVKLSHLPADVASAADAAWDVDVAERPETDPLRQELVARLYQHRGNVTQVARAMGKARQQIQRWMRRFDLDPASFKDDV